VDAPELVERDDRVGFLANPQLGPAEITRQAFLIEGEPLLSAHFGGPLGGEGWVSAHPLQQLVLWRGDTMVFPKQPLTSLVPTVRRGLIALDEEIFDVSWEFPDNARNELLPSSVRVNDPDRLRPLPTRARAPSHPCRGHPAFLN
jgi:hypothetical protein